MFGSCRMGVLNVLYRVNILTLKQTHQNEKERVPVKQQKIVRLRITFLNKTKFLIVKDSIRDCCQRGNRSYNEVRLM